MSPRTRDSHEPDWAPPPLDPPAGHWWLEVRETAGLHHLTPAVAGSTFDPLCGGEAWPQPVVLRQGKTPPEKLCQRCMALASGELSP